MKLKAYLDYLVEFLRDYQKSAHANGYIIGISGGIDSAVCAALIKKACGDNCLGLILPCYSDPSDEEDAILVAKTIGMDFKTISLNEIYDSVYKSLISSFKVDSSDKSTELALANTKVRLRMVTLYMIGQMNNYLVVGTDNLPETYTGYFTKHGDGAADIFPLRHLTKAEVREAAKILGIPDKIIDRKPSAGLIPGITDEIEMGVSYTDLDAYLLGAKIDDDKAKIIEALHSKSEHKRHPAVEPKPFER